MKHSVFRPIVITMLLAVGMNARAETPEPPPDIFPDTPDLGSWLLQQRV